jgi:hypothetical protein
MVGKNAAEAQVVKIHLGKAALLHWGNGNS